MMHFRYVLNNRECNIWVYSILSNTTVTVFQLVFVINTSWKTVIVVLDGIYPYITFMYLEFDGCGSVHLGNIYVLFRSN
jgi:hypothetical protein